MTDTLFETSEEWLTAAGDTLRPAIAQALGIQIPVPRYTVGFPAQGRKSNTLGETYPMSASRDGVNEIIIRITLTDPVEILGVLAHELIHVAMDCRYGHGKRFTAHFNRFGFIGSPVGHTMSPDLRIKMAGLASALGEYPRREGLNEAAVNSKQTTRMLKATCQTCGMVYRTTQKWIDLAAHINCGDRSCAGPVIIGSTFIVLLGKFINVFDSFLFGGLHNG